MIEADFWRAIRFAQRQELVAMCADAGLSRRVQWGLARGSYYGPNRGLFEPLVDGQVLAFIVPCVEGDELVDLAAIDGLSQHVGTRLGIGRALGLDAVERARSGRELRLVERPLDWLLRPVDAVYLFNLHDAEATLRGVAEITCATVALAERLQSLLPPSQHDRVVLDG